VAPSAPSPLSLHGVHLTWNASGLVQTGVLGSDLGMAWDGVAGTLMEALGTRNIRFVWSDTVGSISTILVSGRMVVAGISIIMEIIGVAGTVLEAHSLLAYRLLFLRQTGSTSTALELMVLVGTGTRAVHPGVAGRAVEAVSSVRWLLFPSRSTSSSSSVSRKTIPCITASGTAAIGPAGRVLAAASAANLALQLGALDSLAWGLERMALCITGPGVRLEVGTRVGSRLVVILTVHPLSSPMGLDFTALVSSQMESIPEIGIVPHGGRDGQVLCRTLVDILSLQE